MTALRAGSATDIGMVRATNQDQFLVSTPLFAVADGMGGHAAGEVASKVAVDALGASFHDGPTTPEGLEYAARAANREVWEHAQTDPDLRGMGTTLVAIALVEADDGTEQLAVANVGDSRAYRLRDEQLAQVTTDHSLVQELIDEGQIDEEAAAVHPQRHVLTRALGVDPDVAVDLILLDPVPGDRFLLCSDGLIREVGDDLVASVLMRLSDPDEASAELVHLAKEHGGTDNITVVVVDVVDSDEGTNGSAATTAAAQQTVELPDGPPLPGPESIPPPPPAPADEDDPPAAGTTADATVAAPIPAAAAVNPPTRRTRLITGRVIAFVVALVVLLGIAVAAVGWYARDSYFVGLKGNQLVIFQGRPGGVLWFEPTIARYTGVNTTQVLPAHLRALEAGTQTGSLSAAKAYVHNLQTEATNATTTTTSTTTTSTTTTVATSTTVATTTTATSSTSSTSATPPTQG